MFSLPENVVNAERVPIVLAARSHGRTFNAKVGGCGATRLKFSTAMRD